MGFCVELSPLGGEKFAIRFTFELRIARILSANPLLPKELLSKSHMSLELSQLHNLLLKPRANVWVGHLPEEAVEYLGSRTSHVYLSGDSLAHILKEHPDMTLFDMLILPLVIERGLWIGDRKTSCCISYENAQDEKRYKAGIKTANEGCEHYVTTLHRTSPRQTKSLLKRGVTLRTHL